MLILWQYPPHPTPTPPRGRGLVGTFAIGSDVYISSCPILDVVSQGETEEEAKNNLVEAVTAFAISCFERGTLEKVLEQCGFKPVGKEVLS